MHFFSAARVVDFHRRRQKYSSISFPCAEMRKKVVYPSCIWYNYNGIEIGHNYFFVYKGFVCRMAEALIVLPQHPKVRRK